MVGTKEPRRLQKPTRSELAPANQTFQPWEKFQELRIIQPDLQLKGKHCGAEITAPNLGVLGSSSGTKTKLRVVSKLFHLFRL